MMWLILQYEKPEDWVISTGTTTTVRDFIKKAFLVIGVEIEFEGNGVDEIGIIKSFKNKKYDLKEGQVVVKIDKKYFRPTEVDLLVGDSTKAKKLLNWQPKISLDSLIEEMVMNDIKITKNQIS